MKQYYFYSIYLNILSIIFCMLCIVVSKKCDKSLFIISIVLTILVVLELISNIIHFYNKNQLTKNIK